jgi:hypoxanthine phosphoribosyltransferase
MLRRPLELKLHAAVVVVDEVVDIGSSVERLLQGVQRQVASERV